MLPLIVEGTLGALVGATQRHRPYNYWAGMLFWIPAIAGGAFGLLGGYLTDRLGRRRVLTWSILIYAFSALAAGFSTNIWQFLFFRCTTWIGVCVEFVAAVAWLAEIFTRSEAARACARLHAGVLVGRRDAGHRRRTRGSSRNATIAAADLRRSRSVALHADVGRHPGAAADHHPAVPAGVAGLAAEEDAPARCGGRASPSSSVPRCGASTIVTTLMFAMAYGAAFGAIQQMPQHRARHARGREHDARSAVPADPVQRSSIRRPGAAQGPSVTERAVVAGDRRARRPVRSSRCSSSSIVSRRGLLRVFQVPGLIVVPLVFWFAPTSGLMTLKIGMFFAGLVHRGAVQLLGQLPAARVPDAPARHGRGFRRQRRRPDARHGVRLRDADAVAATLSGPPHVQLATAAAAVALFVYAAGFALSFFLPEPKGEALPE